MFRNELQQRLLKNEKIKASMENDQLNATELSALIDQAYDQALPLLQRYAYGSLFTLDVSRKASKEDMIELLEGQVLLNFPAKQATLKL